MPMKVKLIMDLMHDSVMSKTTHMVSDDDMGIALCRKSLDLLCFLALDDPMDAGEKSPEEKEGKVCLWGCRAPPPSLSILCT